MTDITLPSSIVTIGNYAFSACTKLVSINLPSSLVTIGDYAFAGCTVASLSIPPSVTHFGEFAFLTTKFKTISIPVSITEISNNSFKSSSLTSISIPTSVTKIGVDAFFMSDSLTSVTLTSSLKTIEAGAFSHCISLPSLTIPNSVTNLGNGALEACFSLSEISIPSSVISIGSNCFLMDEKLKKVTLNALTASIGERAFYGCSGLEEFNVYATTPYDLSSTTEVFYNIPTATCILHVPTGSKALYKAAAQWKNFTNIVDDLPVIINTPTLSVSTSNISFLATPNKSIQITLNTNTTWTAISDQTWLTISPSSGTNDATVSLYATANTGLLRTAQISITATGVSPKTIIVTQEAGTTITQQIPLEKGWNLVSVNLLPDNAGGRSFPIATLFAGLDVETIKTIDSFWTKDQADALNRLKTITTGEGYLVKMNAAGTLHLTGVENQSSVTIPNATGWMLIGCPYQVEKPLSSLFTSANCTAVKSFEGHWQPAGSLNSIQSIEPGKAYFIKK